ncbi:hypothetical protein BpHYR1_043033 [Brachionus plicatilis]|uniref:Uncharacterized protein n=1 Tax=Brachionus plicatilis TaxID=10195 RepID=A0A3M7QLS4_BRAPC|nr:hypothetical protein BpHYR1_043033 [Brachionus plicatilis]
MNLIYRLDWYVKKEEISIKKNSTKKFLDISGSLRLRSYRENMTPEQKEKETKRYKNRASNKTPTQIIQSQESQQRHRKNMTSELAEIEKNRLAELNK